MKYIVFITALILTTFSATAQTKDTKIYELRIYYCDTNKLDDLITRFTNHTTKLFERHGMTNIGYWLPIHNDKNALYYILAYPGMKERDSSWNAFNNDPEWKKVRETSEANGRIVLKVESIFMNATDYSMFKSPVAGNEEKVFELRTYFLYPGKLVDINNRFKNFTIGSFEKHGMKNIAYWNTVEKSDTIQPRLIYLLSHKSEAAAKASFESFGADPERKKVFDASEANGKIVERIESVFLKALPFSPIK